jgi:hypothetical protein
MQARPAWSISFGRRRRYQRDRSRRRRRPRAWWEREAFLSGRNDDGDGRRARTCAAAFRLSLYPGLICLANLFFQFPPPAAAAARRRIFSSRSRASAREIYRGAGVPTPGPWIAYTHSPGRRADEVRVFNPYRPDRTGGVRYWFTVRFGRERVETRQIRIWNQIP